MPRSDQHWLSVLDVSAKNIWCQKKEVYSKTKFQILLFIYLCRCTDPLVSWRSIADQRPQSESKSSSTECTCKRDQGLRQMGQSLKPENHSLVEINKRDRLRCETRRRSKIGFGSICSIPIDMTVPKMIALILDCALVCWAEGFLQISLINVKRCFHLVGWLVKCNRLVLVCYHS